MTSMIKLEHNYECLIKEEPAFWKLSKSYQISLGLEKFKILLQNVDKVVTNRTQLFRYDQICNQSKM